MTRIRHSTPYDKLAVAAGLAAGLDEPTPDSVSNNDDARAARNELWLQYEMRLTDTNTYTLEEIRQWLAGHSVTVGRTVIHRDRHAVLARETAVRLAGAKAAAIVKAVGEQTGDDIFAGGRLLAAQAIFDALSNLGPEALDNMTVPQTLKMIDALSRLSKSHAETEMIEARLAQMRQAFDDQVEAAKAKASDGRLSEGDIAEIRRAVFGEAA